MKKTYLPVLAFLSLMMINSSICFSGNSSSVTIEEFEKNNQNKTIKFEDVFLKKTFEPQGIKQVHLISIKDKNLKNPTNKSLLMGFVDKYSSENKNVKVQIFLSKRGFVNKKGVLNMSKKHLPSNLMLLSFKDKKGITKSIGNDFLSDFLYLKSFDTQGLLSVTSIGKGFLSDCISLKKLNTQGLSSVTSIGDNFLYDCDSIKIFDTQWFTSLISIGSGFLFNCRLLKEIITTKRKSFFWNKNFSKEILKKIEDKRIILTIIEKKDIDTAERIEWLNDENYLPTTITVNHLTTVSFPSFLKDFRKD